MSSSEKKIHQNRRDFMITASAAVAAAGTGLLLPGAALAAGKKVPPSPATGPYEAEGMAAQSPTSGLGLIKFQRRALGPKDIALRIRYCGVCHSDIHAIRGDWFPQRYPVVPGHEFTGEVVAVGSAVTKFEPGSHAGVGSLVNSCRHCGECTRGFEQYCENVPTFAFGAPDRDGTITQGGYSTFCVVDEDFAIQLPKDMSLAHAAPLMCAGITVYSPLRHWGIAPGMKVGVAGLGGLGHLAVKIATAMGAEVTVITTSPEKEKDARRFGAKSVLINKEGADFAQYRRSLDFLLDTIPYQHNLDRLMPLLRRDATYCLLGIGKFSEPNQLAPITTVMARNSLAGSSSGGIRETQELVNFCALHKIKPEIEIVPLGKANESWERVVSKKVRYRHVLEIGNG